MGRHASESFPVLLANRHWIASCRPCRDFGVLWLRIPTMKSWGYCLSPKGLGSRIAIGHRTE